MMPGREVQEWELHFINIREETGISDRAHLDLDSDTLAEIRFESDGR